MKMALNWDIRAFKFIHQFLINSTPQNCKETNSFRGKISELYLQGGRRPADPRGASAGLRRRLEASSESSLRCSFSNEDTRMKGFVCCRKICFQAGKLYRLALSQVRTSSSPGAKGPNARSAAFLYLRFACVRACVRHVTRLHLISRANEDWLGDVSGFLLSARSGAHLIVFSDWCSVKWWRLMLTSEKCMKRFFRGRDSLQNVNVKIWMINNVISFDPCMCCFCLGAHPGGVWRTNHSFLQFESVLFITANNQTSAWYCKVKAKQ